MSTLYNELDRTTDQHKLSNMGDVIAEAVKKRMDDVSKEKEKTYKKEL